MMAHDASRVSPAPSSVREATPTFINAMSGAASQVTVVTTDGHAGRFGVTVSAFASVSAEPPLLLVCINRRSPAVAGIEANDCFCVNLLDEGQSHIANCFAGRPGPVAPYDFSCAGWDQHATGAPVLRDTGATFDCRVERSYDAGTHRIIIGRVLCAGASDKSTLAFSRRAYQSLSPIGADSTKTGTN